MSIYSAPANYATALSAAQQRALGDADFADVLRNIDTYYGERYAHGVLAMLGLARLGSDYAEAAISLDLATRKYDEAQATLNKIKSDVPADAEVERDVFGDAAVTTPEHSAAQREYEDRRAYYQAIKALVLPFSRAGYTPDYDGAPC